MQGELSRTPALNKLLTDTGFVTHRDGVVIEIVRRLNRQPRTMCADAIGASKPVARSAVETVTVTSSKLGGADVQTIPISITALSQEQLTATQTAGGPDLVKQVPNLTFSKTNFTGYNIQIRGIGTQAISVTTDPAVAVALNDMPFLRTISSNRNSTISLKPKCCADRKERSTAATRPQAWSTSSPPNLGSVRSDGVRRNRQLSPKAL